MLCGEQIREKDNLVADLGAKIFQLQDDFKVTGM